jgi:hypothetical protein
MRLSGWCKSGGLYFLREGKSMVDNPLWEICERVAEQRA